MNGAGCDALDAARAEIARLTEQAGNRRQRNVELVNANTALVERAEKAEATLGRVAALLEDPWHDDPTGIVMVLADDLEAALKDQR